MKYKDTEDETSSQSVTAGTTVTLITIRVPPHTKFIVTKFANYVAAGAAWGNLEWNINVDGMPVPKYQRIADQIGNQDLPASVPEGIIQAKQILTVTARNTHASTAYTAGTRIQGFYDDSDLWNG